MSSTASPPPPAAAATDDSIAARPGLRGSLGTASIVLMVLAAAAPLTVVGGAVPLGIALGNGSAYPAAFAVCCVVLLLFAVGFCAMAQHVRQAGAFYAYVDKGLGRRAGLGSAFLALVTYTAIQVSVYGYIGVALDGLVQSYGGPHIPWWVWTGAMIALVGVLGYRHVDLSGKVLGALLIGEVGIVLALDAAVVATGGDHGLSTALVTPSQLTSGSPGVAVTFAIAAFIGFEATAVFRSEARDPDRTIPRATYLALALVGGFYTLSSWALVSAWGDEQAVAAAGRDPEGMLMATVSRYLGPFAEHLAQALFVTSLFACVLSFHHVIARYLHSLAEREALPSRLGRAHPRHHSPYTASLVQTASAAALIAVFTLAGMDPITQIFTWMAGVATAGVDVLMLLTCVAVLVFFHRTGSDTRPWHTRWAPALGGLGLAALLTLTVLNFPLLIGGSTTLAAALLGVPAASFVVGVVRERRRPTGEVPVPA
ncbi:APC family permease [Streptomyces sp. NPDC002896]|uniref:APC family permease n=1 Tax=Streptomyces sp. NPDC002896 TaxID=3154438 RepID=UPI0033314E99